MNQSQTQTQGSARQTRDGRQFQLRLPADLKERVEQSATANGRSINTEIVVALLSVFPAQPPNAKAALDLLAYINAATDDLEKSTRAAITEGQLRLLNPRARVTQNPDGSVAIVLTA